MHFLFIIIYSNRFDLVTPHWNISSFISLMSCFAFFYNLRLFEMLEDNFLGVSTNNDTHNFQIKRKKLD